MAITKQQLKSIVKECLVEILAEGMGASAGAAINEAAKNKNKSVVHHSSVFGQTASKTSLAPRRQPTESLREAIKRESAGNSVMADILRDTAANTLPSMLENEKRPQPVSNGLT